MGSSRKYSASAISLIIILSIRLFSQLLIMTSILIGNMNFEYLITAVLLLILSIFYLGSLIGVIKKTSWGLEFTIITAILDSVLGFLVSLMLGSLLTADLIGAIIMNVVIVLLAVNIIKRTSK